MSAPIEFQIRILGGASEELKKTAGGFGETDKGARHAAEGIKVFEGETGKLRETVGGLTINLSALRDGGSLFTFDLAEGMRAAGEVATRVVESIIDIGKESVKTVAKVEDLNFALTSNLGKEGAEAADRLADSFERTTRIDASQFKQAILPLTEHGITNITMLDRLATTAADISARRNTGVAGFNAYLGALGEISLKGGEKIKGNLRELGIKPAEFYAQLGGLLGKSARDAEALAKAGKVANETLLSTVVHTVAIREGGKGIGAAAVESVTTLGGVLDRLSNLPENLLERLVGTPAMEKVKHVLETVLDRLSGPDGIRLVEKFADLIDSAFGAMSDEDVVTAIEAITDDLKIMLDVVKAIAGYWKDIVDLGDKAAKYNRHDRRETDLGNGKKLIVQQEDLDRALWRGIKEGAIPKVAGQFDQYQRNEQALNFLDREGREEKDQKLGKEYAEGIAAGMVSEAPTVSEAAVSLASSATEAAAGPAGFDAHSPSRKGIRLGRFYAQGIGEGMESESDRLSISATRTISQSVDVRGGAGGRGGGTVIHMGDTIIHTAATSPDGIAQAIRIEDEKKLARLSLALGIPVAA